MTPAPVPPQPAPGPGRVMSLVGPVLAGFLGSRGSMRRYLFGFGTTLVLMLNHKLGLGLSTEEQLLICGFVATNILGSNAKEAVVANAEAKVRVANADATATIKVAEAGAAAPAEEPAP